MSTLLIPYQSDDFPPSLIQHSRPELKVDWSDLLWAALTVGRASWADVWRHGYSSGWEAIFRWSLVKMALEERPWFPYLHATDAFKNMDPSERGAINYFLGMIVCKLFAAKLLDTPWLLHLDVYHSHLRPELRNGSRPDLVGPRQGPLGSWRAFECKGRQRLVQATKDKAKAQAHGLVSVTWGANRVACDLHVGAVTHFRRGELHFYWRDPERESRRDGSDIDLTLPPGAWRYYYAPAVDLIQRAAIGDVREEPVDRRTHAARLEILLSSGEHPVFVNEFDIQIGVHHAIAENLANSDWDGAQRRAAELTDKLAGIPNVRPDGLIVRAGPSWSRSRRSDFESA